MNTVVYDKEIQKVPIKIWADLDKVEVSALSQLKNTASLPFVFKHVAAMPDVHLGKGATVGSVVACRGAVVPAAVGVDIGCGMMALRLKIEPARVLDNTKEIRHSIERSVPVGHLGNSRLSKEVESWAGWEKFHDLERGTANLLQRATSQLGSLGGGNHFIELCQDTTGAIWVMLHSGSRNIGKTVAEGHIAGAKNLMKAMYIRLPDPDLAYYVEGTPEYLSYIRDLMWCQEYAAENRREMMRRILKDISYAVGLGGAPIETSMAVNCHHNYAAMENHYGENVLITRKGAVRARQGDLGIIPGSMGTRSYIVEGLGNDESFHSCSHGAGRRMSRTQAKKQFTLADLAAQTAGVDCRKDEGVLDEIPGAYKDIDEVMANQKDLVRVVAQLKQFMCIKG
jgi:tRNA-splicing ligase RtcB